MSVREFLSRLRSLGIEVSAQGDRLNWKAPKGALTPELQAQLDERKAEILAFLSMTNLVVQAAPSAIQPASRNGPLPLSFAQQRLWFLDQLIPNSSMYNIPSAVRLAGAINVTALEQALSEIIRRHEVLRTVFADENGQTVQVISKNTNLSLPVVDLQEFPETEREVEVMQQANGEVQKPFDLTQVPLIRARLLHLAEQEYVLILTLNHTVSDGWSTGILYRELSELYEAFSTGKPSPLPELPIQYADFAIWQREWMQGETLEAQLSYWREQLAGAPPVLELPSDKPRPPVQTYRGEHRSLVLSESLTGSLNALSRREGGTLFMTLLAAFKILLYRLTGQEDIVVGSPIAGRNRSEIEELIGFFVNSLVLRTDLSGNPGFLEILGRVRDVCFGAYEHQDMPFEKLVEELRPERDPSCTPFFQIWLNMLNLETEQFMSPRLTVVPLPLLERDAKFALTLYILERNNKIQLNMVYNRSEERRVGKECRSRWSPYH